MTNFQDLSLNELLESRDEIDRLITQRRKEAKDSLLSEFREKAETLGIDFDELVSAGGKKRPSIKKAPKYRNPEQATETWTGTGRQPNWVKQQLANGRQLEDLAIG